MISVTEAKEKIINNTGTLKPVKSVLSFAAGKVLAEDVYSLIDIPAFDQSSMDGYAFAFNDWKPGQPFEVKSEIAAGGNPEASLSPGNAARIFTGAPVPRGADTVVMQEKVMIQNNRLVIDDDTILPGLNVRMKGTEIRAGELAMAKGNLLTPAAIGFLASVGVSEVWIYPFPFISIIVTGNELQSPGNPLQPGQVYESNSFSLCAALKLLGITEAKVYKAEDTLEQVTGILNETLRQSDIVCLTGGISAGDYDFVLQAATECGVEKFFHKVKQRPGKPLFFGKKENKLIFGLPGNPSSVLTCFYEYVIPALEKLSCRKKIIQTIEVPLAKPVKKNTGLTHFLKGSYNGKTATPLDAQESYRLSSFAIANCLIKVDEEVTLMKEGDLAEVHLLPI